MSLNIVCAESRKNIFKTRISGALNSFEVRGTVVEVLDMKQNI